MKRFVRDIAATEGWTDATTVEVLTGVLQHLVDMGAADREDLEAMVRERTSHGGDETDEGPEDGDVVEMHGHEVAIIVESVPDHQPESSEGIWTIIDRDGETHRIEREGIDDPWYVVVPAI